MMDTIVTFSYVYIMFFFASSYHPVQFPFAIVPLSLPKWSLLLLPCHMFCFPLLSSFLVERKFKYRFEI